MRIPQIKIHTTHAQIEINTKKGQMLIEQPPGELEIDQPQATVNITRIPGKLTIDQTQARADVDLKSIRQRIEEAAQLGKQSVLAGIARRAQEGEELMRIENGFGAISSISKKNSDGPKKEFNIGWIPKAGSVKIQYDPVKIEVEAEPNKPILNYKVNKPNITHIPSEVTVSLKQYPDINIDFE
jgi:hypothetical protein